MSQTNKNTLPGLKEKRYQQKKDIIGHLYKMGELSKPEICRFTNMTTPTISRIVEELTEEGWVIDRGQGRSIGGKRPHIFSLNPDAAYIMGVDIGREYVKIAIFNLNKEIIGNIRSFPSVLESHDNKEILRQLKVQIDETLQHLSIAPAKIKVAGFSLPGLIDTDGTSYTYLTYEDTSIRKVLENMLHIPIFIDNDSTIMAMAEHFSGAAQGAAHALCINVNECIGMGMILNSQPYSGSKGMAGEFGHTRISGLATPCYCGKAGCLETAASGHAIVKAAREGIDNGRETAIRHMNNGHITLSSVIQAASEDDIFAIDLLQEAGGRIGEALATLIHLFNPEQIVIGGEISAAGNLIIAPIQQSLNKYTLTRLRNQCEIKISPLGNRACILGTLMVVMKHLFYDAGSEFSLY